ncbi:MAG: glycosyltransferase [Ramlibacter sp.]|nr:glycosyltransferase [Ramlibacter sp.]
MSTLAKRWLFRLVRSIVRPGARVFEAIASRALRRIQVQQDSRFAEMAAAQAAHLHAVEDQVSRLAGIQAAHSQSLEQDLEARGDRLGRSIAGQQAFIAAHSHLMEELRGEAARLDPRLIPAIDLSQRVRSLVRKHAGLPPDVDGAESEEDLLRELRFLWENSALVRPMLQLCAGKRVLYPGQCYYNLWYLSRELRALGWKADVFNWDSNPASQIYYHGEDFRFVGQPGEDLLALRFYAESLYGYDVFHFSNAHGIGFGSAVAARAKRELGEHGEIHLLRALGKKIVYTNNGCLDGVSQTSFSRWGPESACASCRWRDVPAVCSDQRNLQWGRFRNSVADYQCLLGGNRADYNDDPRVHENPWVYSLDAELWKPGLEIPPTLRVARRTERTLLLYHAVGNARERTRDGVNIKSTHIYAPLVGKLQAQGWDIELVQPEGVPNREVRFVQAQADIFLEMLTFGWFGANAREAMMLGKPVICYIRPEWLQSLREEVPGYADELPIVHATPDTAGAVLLDLLADEGKRRDIGRRSREFMLRWHSSQVAAVHFDEIYRRLVQGDPLLRQVASGRVPAGAGTIPVKI